MTGYVPSLAKLSGVAHRLGAQLFVDAAQLAPHRPINMKRDGIDALAFSAHKVYAPFGLGVTVVLVQTAHQASSVQECQPPVLIRYALGHDGQVGKPILAGVLLDESGIEQRRLKRKDLPAGANLPCGQQAVPADVCPDIADHVALPQQAQKYLLHHELAAGENPNRSISHSHAQSTPVAIEYWQRRLPNGTDQPVQSSSHRVSPTSWRIRLHASRIRHTRAPRFAR